MRSRFSPQLQDGIAHPTLVFVAAVAAGLAAAWYVESHRHAPAPESARQRPSMAISEGELSDRAARDMHALVPLRLAGHPTMDAQVSLSEHLSGSVSARVTVRAANPGSISVLPGTYDVTAVYMDPRTGAAVSSVTIPVVLSRDAASNAVDLATGKVTRALPRAE